jgi:hypothetical protein
MVVLYRVVDELTVIVVSIGVHIAWFINELANLTNIFFCPIINIMLNKYY